MILKEKILGIIKNKMLDYFITLLYIYIKRSLDL